MVNADGVALTARQLPDGVGYLTTHRIARLVEPCEIYSSACDLHVHVDGMVVTSKTRAYMSRDTCAGGAVASPMRD